MSVFVANCLPAKCFFGGPKRWKLLDPILPTELVTDCYGLEFMELPSLQSESHSQFLLRTFQIGSMNVSETVIT
jgi:hypothetical protein